MLSITCPVCGVSGDDADFAYGGQAHVKRPASSTPNDVSLEAQRDYLFMRDNPRGPHRELWMCARGCGKWFHMVRDTLTQEILATYKISDPAPPLGGTPAGGTPAGSSATTGKPRAAAKRKPTASAKGSGKAPTGSGKPQERARARKSGGEAR
jgi:heterotetrameric sarcosine oxidase delta subunit